MGKTSLNKCFTGHCGEFFVGNTSGIDTKKPHNKTCYKVLEGGRWDSNPRPSEPQSVTLTD